MTFKILKFENSLRYKYLYDESTIYINFSFFRSFNIASQKILKTDIKNKIYEKMKISTIFEKQKIFF